MIHDNHSNIPITKLCENGLLDWILIPTPSLTKINVDIDCSIIAVNIREVNRKYLVTATGENPLCMKTFGNGRKALQRNVKLLQLYNCTFEKMTNRVSARCQQGVSKVLTSCQQGVNKLSTRCQICNDLPMKNMQVILSVFVCRQKIIFVFVFAFVIFWREGRGPKKNILKNGGGDQNVGF